MSRGAVNLLELDIDKLFEDHKIEEIVEIEKLLDAEIERKRVELRSMVGDRYKDVLTASDAIKSMKTISQDIVGNIQSITDVCEQLIIEQPHEQMVIESQPQKENNEERVLIIQVRLTIFMNEQIWIALDNGDNLSAVQYYLLAQHIHTGLNLSKKKYLEKLPLLNQIKSNLNTLKMQIFNKITQKMQSVEITAEETSSNLNALLLLQNQSPNDLLNIFIDHRIKALNTVMNSSHTTVRNQVSAMVRCLITTVHLLHDCFILYKDCGKGLIWHQLETIIEDTSSTTLSKLQLPATPLISFIPEIIRSFRPKCKNPVNESVNTSVALEDWLKSTKTSIEKGLESSLNVITSVKGLHIIREEALKIEIPADWDKICAETGLPVNFNVWFYFFQQLVTARAKALVTKKASSILENMQLEIRSVFRTKSDEKENDLRWYTWFEDSDDVSRSENKHQGLSLKTLGYSQNIVNLCNKFNNKYLELLEDISDYLLGKPFDDRSSITFTMQENVAKKCTDQKILLAHLQTETTKNSELLTSFLLAYIEDESGSDNFVTKSVMAARFLQAIITQCSYYKKCATFDGNIEDWTKISANFSKIGLEFWQSWVKMCVRSTDLEVKRNLRDLNACTMLSILARWDVIEIQEQTEEKIFKSQIKVPLKPSLILSEVLNKLNSDLGFVLPHTLPKQIHLQFIEKNIAVILEQYRLLAEKDLNQNQALQFLFDVKFLTTFSVPRENKTLVTLSQEICEQFRAKIDPFDLDVFYSHLQSNVKKAVLQSQVIMGCLLPSAGQLSNLGVPEKSSKEQEKEPTILALSVPSTSAWFPLLPMSVPTLKTSTNTAPEQSSQVQKSSKVTPKKSVDSNPLRSGAASLFGNLATDWFS